MIKQGATLTCEAQDILDAIAAQQSFLPAQQSLPLKEHYEDTPLHQSPSEPAASEKARFIQSLSLTPIAIDDLVRQTSLTLGQIQLLLLELDLAGRLDRHGNQMVSLKS